MLDPDKIRSFYPGLGGRTYFDAASLGVASTRSLEAVRSMAEGVSRLEASTGDRHLELGRLRHGARAAMARYLNAPPESIALVENTTQGLSLVAATVPLQAGDNVVVGRSDYLQTVLPWQLRRERDGIELRFVESRSDRLELDDVAGCVDDRTRVVCLSSVQWTTGQRLDVAALAELAGKKGAWLVVDAVQHVGAVRYDVTLEPVDFLTGSGHKWLNSPFGCGFLYVGPRAAAELAPPFPGMLAARPPTGDWGTYFARPDGSAADALEFPATARRYETGGTPNVVGPAGLAASVELVLELGAAEVEGHILELSGLLMERLEGMGLEVVTPREPELRAGLVTFHLPGGIEAEGRMHAELEGRGVQLSLRYAAGIGGLRAAVHYFNNVGDVDRLISEIGRLV